MILKRSILYFILFICLQLSSLQARFGHPSEANVEFIKHKLLYNINKDGTYTVRTEVHIRILNESARQNFATQTYEFDKTLSHLNVIEAKTIHEGREYTVSENEIESKPLASDPTGLSEKYQVLIPFKHAVVGSILHLVTEEKRFKAPFKGYFGTNFIFCNDILWKDTEIEIHSAIPLNVKINDPRKHFKFEKRKEGLNEVYSFKLTEPFYECIVHEQTNNYLEPEKQTYISVSSEKDYRRINKIEAQNYESVLKATLPDRLNKIANKAKHFDQEEDQITSIISDLIETIHYLGTWKDDGHLIPRPLDVIVNSGYGDCKEYSVCLVAVLRALGHEAYIAGVFRGDNYFKTSYLPTASTSNHAIVKMISKSGKVYWLDPTNLTAMADGIFPDICDRPAEVLKVEDVSYEYIPPIDHRHSVLTVERIITFNQDHTSSTLGKINWSGEIALPMTNKLILEPESIVKDWLSKELSETKEPYNKKIKLDYNKADRIVKDVKVGFSFEEDNTLQTTNLGHAVPIYTGWADQYLNTSSSHEGAVYIENPQTINSSVIFKGVKAKNLEALAFSVKSPWLNAQRKLVQTKEGIKIISTMELLKSIITPEEIRSPEFENLKKVLRKYCSGISLVVERK